VRVVALVTCHNRRTLTLRCLHSLFSQELPESAPIVEAVVVDDGSTDGTSDAIRAEFDHAFVVHADGSLYWARGMQVAEIRAAQRRPEYFLWLNDDVTLDPTALSHLLATADACPEAIVVGALRDPETGAVTYSGVKQSSWHVLRTRVVQPGDEPRDADTFNGNVVLVPRAVSERVGPIDGGFAHSQADFDYGLRAREERIRIVVAAGTVGVCPRGHLSGTFRDTTLPLRTRWRLIQGPKGLPMRSHARFLRRHGGRLWPLFWAAPYVKLVVSAVATAPRRLLGRG